MEIHLYKILYDFCDHHREYNSFQDKEIYMLGKTVGEALKGFNSIPYIRDLESSGTVTVKQLIYISSKIYNYKGEKINERKT